MIIFPMYFGHEPVLPWFAGPLLWMAGLYLLSLTQRTHELHPRFGAWYYLFSSIVRPLSIVIGSFGWFEVLGQKNLPLTGPGVQFALYFTALIFTGALAVMKREYALLVLLSATLLAQTVAGFHLSYYLGRAVMSLGAMFGIWSLFSLGLRRSFLFRKVNDPLVTRGPYSWIRHPQLMAASVQAFAICFLCSDQKSGYPPHAFGLFNAILFTTAVRFVARNEDNDLSKAEGFTDYVRQIAAFSPSRFRIILKQGPDLELEKIKVFKMTAIEVAIVIAILGILAALARPGYMRQPPKSKQSEAKINLGAIFTAQMSYHEDAGFYLDSFDAISWRPWDGNFYAYCIGGDLIEPNHSECRKSQLAIIKVFTREHCPKSQLARIKGFTREHCSRWTGASPDRFTVMAVGDIDRDQALDVWTINEKKQLVNLCDDAKLKKCPPLFS